MYCNKCGQKLSNDAKFCVGCGTKIAIKTQISNTQANDFNVTSSNSGISIQNNTPIDLNDLRNSIVNCFNSMHYDPKDYFGKIEGQNKSLAFLDKNIIVSAEKDAFNSYRLAFRNLAIKYSNKFIYEYNILVNNLESFVEYFPDIYLSNLEYLIRISTDVFAAENVWTQTYDTFLQQHLADFHLAMDDYNTILESIDLTVEKNRNTTARRMSYLPRFGVAGFGLAGMVKSAAIAVGMNAVRGKIIESKTKAAKLGAKQKNELFHRIEPEKFFHRVFLDYWRVFLSVVYQLREKNKNVWWVLQTTADKAYNMFQNLSNPRFPQNQIVDTLMQIIDMYPYEAAFHRYMMNRFGDTKQIAAIRNYFGYFDFNNPRIL